MLIDFDLSIVLILFVVYILCVGILKRKYRKSKNYILFFTLLFIYLSEVLNYTQFPIRVLESMRRNIGQNVFQTMNLIPLIHLKRQDMVTSLLNIVMTIPYGFLLSFLRKQTRKTIVIHGLALGFVIESLQFIIALTVGFTMRSVDVNDIIFNFIGVLIGFVLYKIFILVFVQILKKFSIQENSLLKYIKEMNLE